MVADVSARCTGLKPYRPDPFPGPLHQQRFAKRIAVFRKERVGDLLNTGVDRANNRNSVEQLVPPADQLSAKEIARDRANTQNNSQRKQHAKARDVKSDELVGVPAARQYIQGLVKRSYEPVQQPHRDAQRHQHQQPGKQPFAQGRHYAPPLAAAGAGALTEAGAEAAFGVGVDIGVEVDVELAGAVLALASELGVLAGVAAAAG